MAVKPLKDPRFKPVPGKQRRYLDSVTGEIINRTEFERRTNPAKAKPNLTGSAGQPRKNLGNLGPNPEPVTPGSTGSGPVPVVEAPEAPPMVQAAYDVTREAAEVAHAASAGMEVLATKIGHGIAQCASYAAEAFLPASRAYWAPPEEALRQITEPGARIWARHSHVSFDLGPDTSDVGDIVVGVMACITAISVQKIQYEQARESARLQAIHDFEVANGPGSYAAAVAAMRGANASGASQAGQAQNGAGHQNGGGSSANGATPHRGPDTQGNGRVLTLTDQLLREHGRASGIN